MIIIVLLHLILHGYGTINMSTNSYSPTHKDPYFLLILAFVMPAVNCFIFISGYYQIRFRIKPLISFLLQAIFYSFSITIFYEYFVLKIDYINYESIIKSFFPISNNVWWFANVYIALLILSPLINKGAELLTRNQFRIIILLLLYLQASYIFTGQNLLSMNGNSFFTLFTVYIIARYCRLHISKVNYPFIKFISTTIFLFIAVYVLYLNGEQTPLWRLLCYNSPFIILSAVYLFYSFQSLNTQKLKRFSAQINWIAPLCFSVYLIHDHFFSRHLLRLFIKKYTYNIDSIPLTLLLLFGAAIVIFAICSIIEFIRQLAFAPLLDKIGKTRIVAKLEAFISPPNQ